jgi:two-component system nitrogen regulation sensor histidine kinase NtrY
MFGLLSSVPALILTVMAVVFSYYMINSWFDKRITSVLDESVHITESYLKEYQETIRTKAQTISNELDKNILQHDLALNLPLFASTLNSIINSNDISEAVVFHGHIPIVKSQFGNSLSIENVPEEYYTKARSGEYVVFRTANKIRVISMLHSMPNSFLVVGRYTDNKAIEHIKKSIALTEEYKSIGQNLSKLQLKFYLAFLLASITLLLLAGLMGISLSAEIVRPIIRLVDATKSVIEGKFDIKLPEGPKRDEIANLSRAFNVMAQEVSQQRNKLLKAYNALEQEKKLVEMVLSGVSTGIIALSPEYKVNLINDAGIKLLHLNLQQQKDMDLGSVLPECTDLVERAVRNPSNETYSEVKLRRSGRLFIFLIKVAVECSKAGKVLSYIIAFDDMTQVFQVQRNEAWSDIARRIAHEVKNPLTPIYLAAERLKEKYSEISKDKYNFDRYVVTIMKHAQDIGTIIEEFSRFAKMPAPNFKKLNLSELVSEVFFSYKMKDSTIEFISKIQGNIIGAFDSTQIRQLLLNILKNAEESIQSVAGQVDKRMFIKLTLSKKKNLAYIVIEDSGKGFEQTTVNKVIEPYFTTKTKGTGLGLAIVKKIVDDHDGTLIIRNSKDKNAVVEMILPLDLNHQNSNI